MRPGGVFFPVYVCLSWILDVLLFLPYFLGCLLQPHPSSYLFKKSLAVQFNPPNLPYLFLFFYTPVLTISLKIPVCFYMFIIRNPREGESVQVSEIQSQEHSFFFGNEHVQSPCRPCVEPRD